MRDVVLGIRGSVCVGALLCLLTFSAQRVEGVSAWREEAYHPNVMQREGMALMRIVGSPAAIVTEGAQFYEEYSASCGRSMPLSFLTGSVLGCFVMGFEVMGGCIELVSFQQNKTWAYPWEFDEPDQEAIQRMRENHAGEDEGGGIISDAIDGAVDGAVRGAVDNAVERSMRKHGKRKPPSASSGPGGGPGGGVQRQKQKVKPRVQHSSCRGTGICPICRGRGKVGNGIRCTGCGGSGRCRACRGSGYAN